jgi:FAD:protein FMN transferase
MGSLDSFRFTFHAMAADHELQLFAASAPLAESAAKAAIADVARIEAKYSRYRDDSVTTRINRAAGRERVAIDAETAALLRYADQCFRLSEGCFDITSGVLRRVWDFRAQPARVPSADALAAARAFIGWSAVEWDDRGVCLPRRGMEIDFGGIGKEYAADRVAMICLEHGIAHALVNLGGDVRAIGGRPDGSPWRVGIRDPRAPDRAVALLEVDGGAVATSGDYERYFDLDGRRYCHILDPRSGMPVEHWRSVSVVAPLCVVAGSCATIAMLFAERAPAFLAAQQYDYLAIDAAGKLHRPGTHFPSARHPS